MDERRDHKLVISCDDCAMQCSAACDDCVVTFLLREVEQAPETIELDVEQERVVRLLAKAGMIPELRFQVAV